MKTNPELGEGDRAPSNPPRHPPSPGHEVQPGRNAPGGGGYTSYGAKLSSPRDPARPEPAGCLTQQLGTVLTASSRKKILLGPPGQAPAAGTAQHRGGAGAGPSISTGSVGVSPSLPGAGAVFLTALFGASPPANRSQSEPHLLSPPRFRSRCRKGTESPRFLAPRGIKHLNPVGRRHQKPLGAAGCDVPPLSRRAQPRSPRAAAVSSPSRTFPL